MDKYIELNTVKDQVSATGSGWSICPVIMVYVHTWLCSTYSCSVNFIVSLRHGFNICDGIHRKQTLLAGVIIKHMANNSDNYVFWRSLDFGMFRIFQHLTLTSETLESLFHAERHFWGGFCRPIQQAQWEKGSKTCKDFWPEMHSNFWGHFSQYLHSQKPTCWSWKNHHNFNNFQSISKILQFWKPHEVA